MKINFKGKYDKIFENTIYRYQQGGITFGDIVKFKKNALDHEKIKNLGENYKSMIKSAMETDLNLRVSAVKSSRPSTTMNFDAYGTDAATDFFVDIVVEYAPGLWRDPMTVPMEVLEYVDLGANLAPVPDSLKRPSKNTKPSEVVANDAERKNPTKNTKLANTKEPTDGRKGASKPKVYKENTLENVYDNMLMENFIDSKGNEIKEKECGDSRPEKYPNHPKNPKNLKKKRKEKKIQENITGENIGEGDEVIYADDDGQEYYAKVNASHKTGYTITITGSAGGMLNKSRFKPGQELQVAMGEIYRVDDVNEPAGMSDVEADEDYENYNEQIKEGAVMKKYVVSTSDYMGEGPDMNMYEAENDESAILEMFPDAYGEMEDGMTIEQYMKYLKDQNGDGQPYIQIFSVESNKVIFG